MFKFFNRKAVHSDLIAHQGAESSSASGATSVDVSRFNKVINYSLYALVLLVPLFFASWTSEVREFNKQSLVIIVTAIMLGAWVVKILTTRAVSWVKTSLDFILLSYLGVYLVSSLTSIDRASSFLGYQGRFTGSFLSVLAMVLLYFVIVNNVRRESVYKRITDFYLIGSVITLVFSFFQLMGVYLLPFAFTQDRGFNPLGSIVGLAVFAAISVVFSQWIFFAEPTRTKSKTLLAGLLMTMGLIVLFVVNAFIAWLILALSMIGFLAIGMSVNESAAQKHPSANWFWKPMLVLVLSVLFVAFQFLPAVLNPRNIVNVQLPVEIQLSNSTNMSLVGNSLKQGLKSAVLGSGPGTTGLAFGTIKPEDLNKTIVWSLNFDRASSEIAGITIETGILGLLAFELASILFLFYGLYFLMRKSSAPGWKYAFGFFSLWLALYVTHFFYFFNSTFYFLFWLFLALFMAISHMQSHDDSEHSLSFASSPRSAMSWMFGALLMLAVLLVGTFFQAAVIGAEMSYASGIKELNKAEPNFARASEKFGRAVTLNPYRDSYLLAYGQNLIFRASEEAAKEEPNVPQIQQWMSDIISAGLTATQVSPNKASNWSALAQFYTGIRTLVQGTDQRIIDSWLAAIELDPKNPSLYLQLSQAYVNASQTIDPAIAGTGEDGDQDGLSDAREQELGANSQSSDSNNNGVSDGDEVKSGFNPAGAGRLDAQVIASFTKTDQAMLTKAQDAINKAIELKKDLPDSYIALSRVLQQSQKLDEAKAKLAEAAGLFPSNVDILFEQGIIAFNQRSFNEAERFFNTVLAIEANYANAHYSLGLIFDQRGDKTKALASYEKAREISGPNVELEKRINELKAELGVQ